MIARNIAPGLQRRFAFENRKTHDSQALLDLQHQAVESQFTNKMYQISASDIDPEMLHIAQ
jgi:putative N6-adenine-specific DNA methylase